MLASRGFAYHSEETASHAHANCDCRLVPSWDKKGTSVEGYDPEYYYRIWQRIEKAELVDGRFYDESRDEIKQLIKDYDHGFKTSWQCYKHQGKKSITAYQNNVGVYLEGLTEGNLQVEPFTHLEGKEVLLGRWIADSGQDVLYLKPSNDGRRNDATINGLPWEFKQITSSDPLKVRDRINDGKGQSENVMIDLSLSTITKEQAMVQASVALEDVAVKTVMIVKAGKLYLLE